MLNLLLTASFNQGSTGCCPNHFSLALKHFLINLRLVPGNSKTLPSGSTSWNRFSFTSPRFMKKNVSMSAQKDFCLGNNPSRFDPSAFAEVSDIWVVWLFMIICGSI